MNRRDFLQASLGGCMAVCMGSGCQRATQSFGDAHGLASESVANDAATGPYRLDTYCGLYCGACDVMLVNQAYEAASKAPGSQSSPPDVLCHGCKSDMPPKHAAQCAIRQCARGKSIEFCCECKEYPCDKLAAFRDDGHPHHAWGVKNLEEIRQKGSANWLAEQRERWTCPNCGERFHYYSKKCSRCSQPVRNCRVDL